ncbi:MULTISPECIES: peptidylprolyl isomerase [Alphaproteobacteria]|uniref:Parvulin-like PPIase n=2 Tax=Alphaproteobacteria TaxID=28211 RepID=A0A512HCS9_9HYPH|nr:MULTISPECIES: peptidylprolyl isomerase [Alphaproteobacteria]GEO83255.1 peptidyl-prolyl cis-trans isomerase [Ciceribacter naphthalenivorans]GLR20350.1 peptidyl-prolyl cis-trans isomerase [Ciceribacter naphthalenivorans]GLT03206.1 peptidyl-prolyl cis-trans isomerase [Sphingomonas psychrolutea]
MLEVLRKAAHTLVAKLLMLLLVASFGIWGISASLFSAATDTVISVGDQQVSASEFRLAYQRQLSDLGRRFGTQLTTEQAKALGVPNQVYAQLAAGAALDQLSEDMNLGLSKDRLAQLIAEDPAFKTESGQFDRNLFTTRLRNAGLREDDYILERSKVAIRSQIVEATSDGFVAPHVLVDALKAYRNESRAISYLLLTNANIDPIKAADDATLAAWFETVKARYRAPEYRSFSYVKLEPTDIADKAAVPDAAISQDYEAHKKNYEIAGTRTIEQLTFETREMAEAAATELKSGTSFDQLVADQGKTASDVLLGDFTREKLPDPVLAAAAFAITKEGGTTDVVDGALGPVILRITNVKEGRTRPLDEVKDEIREALAEAAAIEDIASMHDQFEDLRAGGSTLEEAASQLKLKAISVKAADRNGKDESGSDVPDLPERAALMAEVFTTDVGVEALPINTGKDGYIWLEVKDIFAEHDRSLDEVREKATADWVAEQQKTALGAKAESLKERAAKGETLDVIAAELGIAVETKAGIRRQTEDAVLGPAAIIAAFSGPVGTVASATGGDPETQILLKVTDVQDQPRTDALANDDAQITQIAKAAGDDILDQMVNRLQNDYGVTINQQLAEQAMVR